MNFYKKLTLFTLVSFGLLVISCDENDDIGTPSPATTTSSTKTNFLFINALSDGGSLDLFANGLKGSTADIGTGQTGYTPIDIQTGFAANGTTAIANTSIRAKATTGVIGGVLGSNDLIYRQTSTGFGNFTSSTGALYTVIALDSLNRPQPLRTFSISTLTGALAADITFYNRANGAQISNDQFKALPTQADKDKCVSLGTIPAGITDPGGPRFFLLTDTYPTGLSGTQCGIRFINAVPNGTLLPTNTRISARLRPASGGNLTLATNSEYVLSVAGGFTPSAGSRSGTVAFVAQTAAAYTIDLSTDAFATTAYSTPQPYTFIAGKSYTIVARGLVGKTGTKGLSAIVVQHN